MLPCDGGAYPCTTMLNTPWLQSPAYKSPGAPKRPLSYALVTPSIAYSGFVRRRHPERRSCGHTTKAAVTPLRCHRTIAAGSGDRNDRGVLATGPFRVLLITTCASRSCSQRCCIWNSNESDASKPTPRRCQLCNILLIALIARPTVCCHGTGPRANLPINGDMGRL